MSIKFILFQGSFSGLRGKGRHVVAQDRSLALDIAIALGKSLIKNGFGIILEGYIELDAAIGESAIKYCETNGIDPRQRIRTYLHNVDERKGFGMVVEPLDKGWQDIRTSLVMEASAVIGLVGGKGTADTIQKAVLAGKPVFPIALVTGRAKNEWERLKRRGYTNRSTGDIDFLQDYGLTPELLADRIATECQKLLNQQIHDTKSVDPARSNPDEKTKILFLAANPVDTDPLRLDEEIREVDEALRRAKLREKFVLEQKLAVRIRDLRRALLDINPDIVHFSGHGHTGGLLLESREGKAQVVENEALGGLFELFDDQVKCVVLNACYSVSQADAICQYIDYVIGMDQPLGDQAAIEFTIGFYDALCSGRSYADAYKFGRNAIHLSGISEHLTPVLHTKNG